MAQKILIVDDSSVMRKMLRSELQKHQYEVIEADNGSSALKKVKEEKPNLIISDINMPIMDGWDFCWSLRKDPQLNEIPFIFLSANNEVSDRVKGIQLGADDYVIKPFSPQELVARVQGLLSRYQKESSSPKEDKSLTGKLTKMDLSNLLQFLNMNGMTGILKIEYRGQEGEIFIRTGDIINARVNTIVASPAPHKALYRILSWKEDGCFVFQEEENLEVEEAFQENSLKLMMDGLKQLDELDKIKDQLPPEDAELELVQKGLMDDPDFRKLRPFLEVVERERVLKKILNASPLTDFQIYQIVLLMIAEGHFRVLK
ncbi:MAG: response regulator [Planctomycetota bacterium]|nr:MAG: response regulator [Planctomycetota bacterium]